MENLDKTYESKLSGKRKAVEKWSNRGESGEAELAKELAALQELERKKIENRLTALILIWTTLKIWP
jgi:hypothetical protein